VNGDWNGPSASPEHSHKISGSIGSRDGVEGRGSTIRKSVVKEGYTSAERQPSIWYVNPKVLVRRPGTEHRVMGRDSSGFGSMATVQSMESWVDDPGTKPRDVGFEPRSARPIDDPELSRHRYVIRSKLGFFETVYWNQLFFPFF
jgi:hypothetical protein